MASGENKKNFKIKSEKKESQKSNGRSSKIIKSKSESKSIKTKKNSEKKIDSKSVERMTAALDKKNSTSKKIDKKNNRLENNNNKKKSEKLSKDINRPVKKYDDHNQLCIYLVIKIATFNGDIFGVYSKKQDAIEVASHLAFNENGGYHTYDVIEVPLNILKEIFYNDEYGQSCKQESIFPASKPLKTPKNEPLLWGT